MSVTPLPTTIDACRNMLAYSRVSSERLLGVFGQEEEIRDWAEREGYEIVGYARDVQVHSLSPAETREGLSAVVTAVEKGEADGVVVHLLHRIGRDFPTQDDAIRRIWRAGGRVFSTDYGEWKPDKPGSPQWRLRRDYARQAEDDLHDLLARLQAGRRRKMANGGYGGGRPFARRYGAELVDVGGKLTWRPIPAEQEVIRRIVAACPDGSGYHAMAKVLNAENVPTATGARWSTKVVRSLALRGPAKPTIVSTESHISRPLEWVVERRSRS